MSVVKVYVSASGGALQLARAVRREDGTIQTFPPIQFTRTSGFRTSNPELQAFLDNHSENGKLFMLNYVLSEGSDVVIPEPPKQNEHYLLETMGDQFNAPEEADPEFEGQGADVPEKPKTTPIPNHLLQPEQVPVEGAETEVAQDQAPAVVTVRFINEARDYLTEKGIDISGARSWDSIIELAASNGITIERI